MSLADVLAVEIRRVTVVRSCLVIDIAFAIEDETRLITGMGSWECFLVR